MAQYCAPIVARSATTVSTQRRLYKKAKLHQGEGLLPGRVTRLEQLGFEWTGENPRHKNWDLRFEELKAFKALYGHAQVPIGFEKNVQLANWTSTQVSQNTGKKNAFGSYLSIVVQP